MPVTLTIVQTETSLGTEETTVILESASTPGPAGVGVPAGGTTGQVLAKASDDDYDDEWVDAAAGGGGGGAPTDVDYLVGTASGSLSAEIVVGTTPGGELGGTWDAPTVDATHSGSSHASVQAAAEATAAAALASHEADTTGVHGIADTSALETSAGAQAKVDAHVNDTTDAHDASAISSVAAGNLSSTDVQAALNELDTEKAAAASAVMDGDTAGGVLSGTYPNPGFASDMATQAELDAHVNDTSAAHAASAISADSTTLVGTGTDVQAVLEELDNGLADHLADATDAHDASAISIADAGGYFTGTEVEAALQELGAGGAGGVALVSTTVGALPNTPTDGQVAWLRCGSSPYNFVGLVYDSTYGKWVSINTWFLSSKDATPLTTTSTSYAAPSTANVQRSLTPWKVYDTAGLSWQFRFIVQGHIAGGAATASYALVVLSGDAAGAANAQGADFGEVTTTSTSDVILDSDWVSLPGGLTVQDFIHPLFRHKTSSAGQANTIAIADVFGRLVANPS